MTQSVPQTTSPKPQSSHVTQSVPQTTSPKPQSSHVTQSVPQTTSPKPQSKLHKICLEKKSSEMLFGLVC